MQAAIASRVAEARSRQLDPLEFLVLLLDDELARRESESVARRVQRAHFEALCDLRDFDFAYNPEVPKAQLWDLASGHFVEDKSSVLLCGPTGVGKTFVTQALGVSACRAGRQVLFTKTAALLADLAGGRADGSWPARLRRYLRPELLIRDDFGIREYTVGQAEDWYEIVSQRYRRGSLILTTNRAPTDLYALFPNPVLAEGLLDRLLNSAHLVTLLGRSYRPQQRPRAPSQPMEQLAQGG
jgi:DNA replication protein DnaC